KETWWQFSPGGSTARMSFKGPWAAALAAGMGYVYIDDAGALHRQGAGGSDDVIATDVAEAAVAPNGVRVAFIHAVTDPDAISGTSAAGVLHKAFVVNVASPSAALSPTSGLPSDPTIDVTSPVSSPDGHQIAFLSGDQVWLMNADGTRPTALTKQDPASFPYSCRALAWTRS